MNSQLNELMATYLEEFNKFKTIRSENASLLDKRPIDWTSINYDLMTVSRSLYHTYIDEFFKIFSQASVEDLNKMFKKMKTTSPTIIFNDIKRFYKKCGKELPAKPSFLEKVKFLTYAFVIEVYVHDYIGRMNERVLNVLV
jgi:hypothetical protein